MYTYEIYYGQQLLAVESNFRKASDFARQILIAGFPVTFNRALKRVPDQVVHVDVIGTVSYLRQNYRVGLYPFYNFD